MNVIIADGWSIWGAAATGLVSYRLNIDKTFSICSGRGFASMFGLGSGHDRVTQSRTFMGSHLGNPVEAWKWQQGGGRNCTVMGESERSRPCRMHGRAWCLQCGPNSSLRVWAGPELRSSNKFGSHSQFQLSLVTSLAPV